MRVHLATLLFGPFMLVPHIGTTAVNHNSKSISGLHELHGYYEMRMNVSAGIVESIGAASMETLERTAIWLLGFRVNTQGVRRKGFFT